MEEQPSAAVENKATNKVIPHSSKEERTIPTTAFISAQNRYDNRRVRDSELRKRVCYECGRVLLKGEREYQGEN
jgi:hypothetical protein